jgi:hypothetical protein
VIPRYAQDIVHAGGVDRRLCSRILIGHAASRHLGVASLPASQRRCAAESGIVARKPCSAVRLFAVVQREPNRTAGKPHVGTRQASVRIRRTNGTATGHRARQEPGHTKQRRAIDWRTDRGVLLSSVRHRSTVDRSATGASTGRRTELIPCGTGIGRWGAGGHGPRTDRAVSAGGVFRRASVGSRRTDGTAAGIGVWLETTHASERGARGREAGARPTGAGSSIRPASTDSTRADAARAARHNATDTDCATREPCRRSGLWPATPPAPPVPPPGFRPAWLTQARFSRPAARRAATPIDILNIGSSGCSPRATSPCSIAPRLEEPTESRVFTLLTRAPHGTQALAERDDAPIMRRCSTAWGNWSC